MRVRFYNICKGTKVAVVQDRTILHEFVGETKEYSAVTFDVPRCRVFLRARHTQSPIHLELDYKDRRDIEISCQDVHGRWNC